MKMIEVKSSNIKKIGFDNNNLYIEYSGGIYVYKQVPKVLYEELINSESKGKYMNTYIKGHYDFDRVKE